MNFSFTSIETARGNGSRRSISGPNKNSDLLSLVTTRDVISCQGAEIQVAANINFQQKEKGHDV